MTRLFLLLALALAPVAHAAGDDAAAGGGAAATAAPSHDQLVAMLKTVDDRQRNNGDYKALTFIQRKEKGQSDLVYQALIYRRDADDKLEILFTKPQSEAGKGYLRLDDNLFFYDPSVGRWERRTNRERIGGTNSQQQDFDQSTLATDYEPTWDGLESLGQYQVDHLSLGAHDGADVAYPTVQVWLDHDTGNLLKRQDFALSGRLMRTTYYPKWEKLYSESKDADVYFPKEIRIFDEVQKGNSTTVVIQQVDLSPLPENIFTKAWLESKSR